MKVTDSRVEVRDGEYCYYIADQKYKLKKAVCAVCSSEFLKRVYKNDKQTTCSRSCGTSVERPWMQKENHPNWKGGRYVDGHGYVRQRVEPKVYRMEHIVQMEQKLGRELEPHENIHHINGNRQDNRIENLELWSTKQPKGQRVEDKVKWAREIIALYGHQFKED